MPVAAIPNSLNVFQLQLAGLNPDQTTAFGSNIWTNQALPNAQNGEGGQDNPLSYNVMPLPQSPPNYILKNFTYYENLQFNRALQPPEQCPDTAVPATAPNRGAKDLQVPTALFYQQNVLFADGPGKDQVVHVENGSWLNLQLGEALVGAYPPPPGSNIKITGQQSPLQIAKQMSVPHGNSVLAIGSYSAPTPGAPTIPALTVQNIYPMPSSGLDLSPYTTPDPDTNPVVAYTEDTNKPINDALALIKPNSYISWNVSTANHGATANIPFEQSNANVSTYTAQYWLLSTDGGETYPYLAYTQNISMGFPSLPGTPIFPHVTTNVLTRKGN